MTDEKQRRPRQVNVRLTEAELEAVKREAKRRCWSVSQVMRNRTLKGLTVEATASETELKAVGQ